MTDVWVLDLDGVVWLGRTAVEGSVDAVARLRQSGVGVGFCTNNSSRPLGFYREKLASFGIADGQVLSSATAAAELVEPGSVVLPCAGPGVIEAMAARGCRLLDRHDDQTTPDAVVVGFHDDFDYAGLRAATRAVLDGAQLIATNSDPLYPDETGLSPGGGALVAAVERATGRDALYAGKPFEPMAALVRSTFGTSGVFVGDTIDTDGAMATRLGWPFGLVLTGNTGPDQAGDAPAGWTGLDLADLVDAHLRHGSVPSG